MSNPAPYNHFYGKSWALIIGINDYKKVSPLGYARQDAEAFADILESNCGFPRENITILVDQDASRDRIRTSFLRYAEDAISRDDRLLVFFAGHGYTRPGMRGDVGYLVPVDGDPKDLATLIRWNELTGDAELVAAKHLLFVMDACYGGLAVNRTSSGSTRFLKDMLKRYSRQVLTAGKADEAVADLGGPRPGHSIFTGHLLDAITGKAANKDGIISANAVMAYVYEHVAKDPHSKQTPHYGFLDGDGDFIFTAPNLLALSEENNENFEGLMPTNFGQIENKLATEIVLSNPLIKILRRGREGISDEQIITAVINSSDPLDFGIKLNLEKGALIRIERFQKVIWDTLNVMKRKLSELSAYKGMFEKAPPLESIKEVEPGTSAMALYLMNEQEAQDAARRAAIRAAETAKGRAIEAGMAKTPPRPNGK